MLKYVVFAVLVSHGETSNVPQHSFESGSCGKRYIHRSQAIGPNESYFGEFPWMVAVMKDHGSFINYVCGGSLIHPRMVLTSAQCVKSITSSLVELHPERKPSELIVRVGEWDLRRTTESLPHEDRNVSRIIVHESANHSLHDYEFNNIEDFALLVLTENVTISLDIQAVCLPDEGVVFNSDQCFVSGWSEKYSDKLLKFRQQVVTHHTCQDSLRQTFLGETLNLTKRFICAGEAQELICNNFEGSPLVCPHPDDPSRYVQVGTFSWSFSCGALKIPNLYSDIGRVRTWIDEQIREIDNPDPVHPPEDEVMSITSLPFANRGCGRRYLHASGSGDSYETHSDESPWIVAILKKNSENMNHLCTSSLIHPQVILSINHCVEGLESSDITIRAGKWGLPMVVESLQYEDRNVSTIIVSGENNNNSISNGFALLILTTPFTLSKNINAICLPDPEAIFDESRCSVIGWENYFLSKLKHINLSVFKYDTCKSSLEYHLGIKFNLDRSFICATDDRGGDPCNKHSGTPLVCPPRKKGGHHVQIGSMFGNIACGKTDVPNIFENVANARSWIDGQMRKHGFGTSSYIYTPGGIKLYIITPTYNRPEQISELTKLSHTLILVRLIHWLVVEDAEIANPKITSLLEQSKLKFEHLTVQIPDQYKNSKFLSELRNVNAVNRALNWLRDNASDGVFYIAGEDYEYDSKLFREIRTTKKVSLFPVGFESKFGLSSPIFRDGEFSGYFDEWTMYREFPVSMIGFAVSVKFLHQRPKASMLFTANHPEDGFIKSLKPLEINDIQFLANNCTRILIWKKLAAERCPAEPFDMKLYNGTNIVTLKTLVDEACSRMHSIQDKTKSKYHR